MYTSRSDFYTLELKRIRDQIKLCPVCGGLGITKKFMRSRLARFDHMGSIDEAEERKARRIQQRETEHSKKAKENPNNSSFGLCRCRIEAEALEQMLIANIPPKLHKEEYASITNRDITILGVSAMSIDQFVSLYIDGFEKALASSIGLNFFGGYNMGKSWISQFMAMKIIRKRYTAHYTPLFFLLELFSRNGVHDPLLQEIIDVDLLVIDDIGSEQQARRRSCSEFSFLMQQRITRNKVTILVFNELKSREEIKTAYDQIFFNACTSKNIDVNFRTRITDEKANLVTAKKLFRKIM